MQGHKHARDSEVAKIEPIKDDGSKGSGIGISLLLGAVAWFLLRKFGPLSFDPHINWPAAFAGTVFLICAINVGVFALKALAGLLDKSGAIIPQGNKGSAGWVQNLRELGKDIKKTGWGPYWGTFAAGWPVVGSRGKEIIADYPSAAVTFGTAGSGKGAGVLLPTALAIHAPKILTCFKGVNTCALMKPLTERGEKFFAINLGHVFPEIIGDSAEYNPLDIITDDFERPGGLADVTTDSAELALQIYPEPDQTQGDSVFWHGGTIDFISMAVQQTVLVHGRGANLGLVNQLLMDRESFLAEMLWAAGRLKGQPEIDGEEAPLLPPMPIEGCEWVKNHDAFDLENYISYYRTKAGEIADLLADKDSKLAGSFLRGAVTAFRPYNITSRAHKVMSRSSFRFRDLREADETINVSIVIDASRKEAQTPIAGLIQWAAMTELKRCGNKDRKIYFLCDETTNFHIHDLPGFLTWGREYGLVIHLFIQSLAAFRKVYGSDAVNTLLSETYIKQFLSGQRDPEMLELIEKLLAEISYVSRSKNSSQNELGIDGTSFSEDSKPLMTSDEIRRTEKTILFIGNNRAALTMLPPYAAIAPFRDQMGDNPFFGKPWRLPVKLRLHRRDGNLLDRGLNQLREKGAGQ